MTALSIYAQTGTMLRAFLFNCVFLIAEANATATSAVTYLNFSLT